MKHLAYVLCAIACAAPVPAATGPFPVAGFWVQIAMAPPGTNDTRGFEELPGGGSSTPAPPSEQLTPTAPPASGGVVPGGVVPTGVVSTGGVSTGVVAVPVSTGGAAPLRVPAPSPGPGPSGAPSLAAPASASGAAVSGAPTSAYEPGIAPARLEPPRLPANCSVVFPKQPEEVGPLGAVVELKLAFAPAACASAPGSMARWIQRAAGGESGVYRFSVAPNPASTPREGVISLGPHELIVRQSGRKVALFAASPSKVVLAVNGGKAPRPVALSVWAEDPALAYSVAPGGEKWLGLRAAPAKKGFAGRRFEVTVSAGGLPRGRHQTMIRVAADGVVNGLLLIPVVVEVR